MRLKDVTTPIHLVCLNCHHDLVGYSGENGQTKILCPCCGTLMVSKVISRRHVQVDVFAPQGEELLYKN